uniref:Uncharacterized protein n=1 Tax=Ciona savignyi TaxID=51511 RepID=H2ZIU9_CIOSA
MEEAQMRSKREMLREIEAAKQEAEKEISAQRNQYQSAIHNLQAELKAEKQVKRELEGIREEKESLEMLVNAQKKRTALEERCIADTGETSYSRLKDQVLASLEEETHKLLRDVERLESRTQKSAATDRLVPPQSSGALRISLLLQEANNISSRWKKIRSSEFGRCGRMSSSNPSWSK